ncbi:MAG: portal protein [Acidimicrobiia bacterium]|nr:portal protein [Acidimicrobiia bacterium]
MAWKKYFRVADTSGQMSPISGLKSGDPTDPAFRNYQSTLPEVYTGHPNRVERYNQYEAMDMDSEINACLDIIAEFATQVNEQNHTAFEFAFHEDPTDNEIKILSQQLKQWYKLNKFDKRMFKVFRNSIKYGDQVFIRDPETFELFWVEMNKVTRVIVNESEGKEPEQYIIQDINPNFQNLTVAAKTTTDFQTQPPGGGYTAPFNYQVPSSPGHRNDGRFDRGPSEVAVDAEHIVHMSLTEGLDYFWPFGQSVLENIFKVYKQKELLEDAILIYRIQRAPERRIFKIDTGNMPAHMAMGFVERIKNEIHQRRIPTQSGGGENMLDATYNPLSINEDYFFPQTADGRGSSVETLPGGQNLGEIDDLRYFNNKLARGLRVPSSYLPSGPDEQERALNDGRVGTALIQEYRFNQYCERIQNNLITKLNEEFKLFLKWRGFNIDASIFDIKFNAPQNFASYRQTELDAARLANFGNVVDVPFLSKRFAVKRFLELTEEEMQENDKMWAEENGKTEDIEAEGADMRGAGVSPGDFDADLDMADDVDADLEMGDEEPGDLDIDLGGAGAPETQTPPTA